MKRKILVLACVAALLCSLAACSLTQAQSISFARQPQSVFVVGDPVKIEDLIEVNVVLTDGTTRNDVPATVRGFDTSRAGVFTATVSYRGASIEFTYYVVNSLDGEFIGGTGTETDPYLIASAEQFKNIANHLDSSFELLADIDFNGETIGGGMGVVPGTFTGTFNGNGKTIKGLRTDSEEAYLFELLKNATLQNFVFEIDSPIAISAIGARDNTYVKLENITMNGSKVTSQQNHGNFLTWIYSGHVDFINCINNASMKGTSKYLAPFLGGYAVAWPTKSTPKREAGSASFIGCVNNADIEAQWPGSFVGNSADHDVTELIPNEGSEAIPHTTYTFENCQNNGKIVGTGDMKNNSRIIGAMGGVTNTEILNRYQSGITESGRSVGEEGYGDNYSTVPSFADLISFNAEGELYLDPTKVNEETAKQVVSFKVQMEFRTARGVDPQLGYAGDTSRFNVIEIIRMGTEPIDTGFRNWSVVSAYGGNLEHPEHENFYSHPNLTAKEGGNYYYVVIDGVTAYYFDFGDYYVYEEDGWAKFTAFGYDVNGNLVCSSDVVANTQNEALLTNAQV